MGSRSRFFAGFGPPAVVLAALFLAPSAGAPQDVAGFRSAEDVLAWLDRYYLDPQPERIAPAIGTLVADPRLFDGKTRVEPLVHFFAAALRGRPDLVQRVQALPTRSGPQARFVTQVASEARGFAPAAANDPGDLDLIWSEYFASGDRERLRLILGVLDLPASRLDLSSAFWKHKSITDPKRALSTLRATAMWSLSTNARRHERVRTFLEDERRAASDPVRRRQLDEMLQGRINMPR